MKIFMVSDEEGNSFCPFSDICKFMLIKSEIDNNYIDSVYNKDDKELEEFDKNELEEAIVFWP